MTHTEAQRCERTQWGWERLAEHWPARFTLQEIPKMNPTFVLASAENL